ncbi:MAG: O-antigen/teichoic acid export membrane protein [Bacteriovoracaceae bacterium]|jgi:O-antigen/teichoic acid export membrane protein
MAIPFLFLIGGPVHSVYYWVGKKEEERQGYLHATWVLTALLSLLVLIIGLPLINIVSNWLDFPLKYSFLMIFSGFIMLLGSHYGETKTALGDRITGTIFNTGFEVLKVISFIFIAWKTKDVGNIFIAYTLVFSIKLIIATILGHKDKTFSFTFDKEKIKEVFWYCFPISISALLGFFVDKVDLLILSSLLDTEGFAYYSMGCLIVPPLIILDMSVQKVLIPKLSTLYNEKKYSVASEHFRKAISDTSFLIIPAIFGLIFFAEPIVTLLYTDKYQSSAIFLKIFAFGYLQYIIPHDAIPRASGNSSWILKIYLLTTPISLVAVFLAAKYSGAEAALTAAIILKFLPKFFGILYSKKLMNWSFKEVFPYSRLFLYSFVALLLSLGSLFVKSFFATELIWFFVCAPIFAVIYLGTLYKLRRKL